MWWLTAIAALLFIPIAIFAKKSRIWWGEIIAFISISIALGIGIFS